MLELLVKGPAAMPGQRRLELGHRGLGTAVSMQAPGPTPPPEHLLFPGHAGRLHAQPQEGPLAGSIRPWVEGARSCGWIQGRGG